MPETNQNLELLINRLADGLTIEQVTSELTKEPYLIPIDQVNQWLRDPDVLKRVIEKSNDLIGQAWGCMWHQIKAKAMLGSIQHSKMLVEFVQNGKRLPDNRLNIIFDKEIASTENNDDDDNTFDAESNTDGL